MNEKIDNIICQNNFQYLSDNDLYIIQNTINNYQYNYFIKLKSKNYNKLYPGLWNRIQQEFSTFIGIDENITNPTKFYMLINGMKELPKCPVCGKNLKNVKNILSGFPSGCSVDCAAKNPERVEKSIETCLRIYGTTHPIQNEIVKEKRNQTNINTYGFITPAKNENVKLKAKQSFINHYGVDNNMKCEKGMQEYRDGMQKKHGVNYTWELESVRIKSEETAMRNHGVKNGGGSKQAIEKIKVTSINNWGVDNYTKTQEYKDNRKQYNLITYGVESYTQTDEFKIKSKQTCLKNHNVENYSQSQDFKDLYNDKQWVKSLLDKQYETKRKNNSWNKSKPEEEYYEQLIELYGKEDIERQYNCERYPYNCDFYIKSLDLFIEVQCSHYHNYKPFDKDNLDHIKELEILKEKAAKHPLNKSNTNQYYEIIKTWTIRDVEKRETAKQNNLNYSEVWKV